MKKWITIVIFFLVLLDISGFFFENNKSVVSFVLRIISLCAVWVLVFMGDKKK